MSFPPADPDPGFAAAQYAYDHAEPIDPEEEWTPPEDIADAKAEERGDEARERGGRG